MWKPLQWKRWRDSTWLFITNIRIKVWNGKLKRNTVCTWIISKCFLCWIKWFIRNYWNLKEKIRNIRFIDTFGSWRCFSGIGFECDSKLILSTIFSFITTVDGSATDFLTCTCFVVFFFSIVWMYIQKLTCHCRKKKESIRKWVLVFSK